MSWLSEEGGCRRAYAQEPEICIEVVLQVVRSILKDTRTSELNIELRSEAQIRLKKSKILLGSYIKQSAAKIQHRL